jgi:DNA-binding transcriptional ArsR family regulator
MEGEDFDKPNIERTIGPYRSDIAEVLSSLANATRLELLLLILDGFTEFGDLVSRTGLSKATLSKHLRVLQKGGLVRKTERGVYQTSEDGRDLLGGISNAYGNSLRRQQQDMVQRARLYSPARTGENEEMKKYVVKKLAEYQPAWVSYLGMTTGILRSLGYDVDTVDVGGYTGQAFHINTARGSTCPSAPTVADFDTFAEGLESFGWKVEQTWEGPCCSYPMNEEETSRARAHFDMLKREIVKTEKPIGIWGTYVPEFGIMNGFEEDSYLVSSFKRLQGAEETPIRYDELRAPGGLFKQIFREPFDVKNQNDIDKRAVERALGVAAGLEKRCPDDHKRYASGIEMFDELAKILERGVVPESEGMMQKVDHTETPFLLYHGNSYTALCNQENLALAAEFLERMAKKYRGKPFHHDLVTASKEYHESSDLMMRYTELFPFSFEKDYIPSEFSEEKRKQGISFLDAAKPHVEKAIQSLKTALTKW